MAEPTAAAAKTDEGTTILTAKEPDRPATEKILGDAGSGSAANAIEAAKAAAVKELAEKQAATDASKKTADDAAAAEAAKKAEEDKTKTKDATTKAPDKAATTSMEYTLELPENSALTKEDLTAMEKQAKAAGLSADAAKELVKENDQLAKNVRTRLESQQTEQLKSMRTQWQADVKADPDLGGEKLAETAIKSSRAAKVIFDAPTLKFLNDTGYGDYPGLIKAMVKVYDLIGEDKFIKGTTGAKSTTAMTSDEKAKKLFSKPIKDVVSST